MASSEAGANQSPEHAHDGHFFSAFLHAIAMVVATELGDKTFFIAAVLALSRNAWEVFLGAWGALASMTVLSALLGLILPALFSNEITHWIATALFLWFGVKAIWDARQMFIKGEGAGVSEELGEVEESLKDDDKILKAKGLYTVVIGVFAMTFIAEWGDKSQIATIAMGAARDTPGVILGAVIGHAMCTGLAVMGGKLLATKVNERTLLLGSGIVFLLFSVYGFVSGPEE